jgi:hypothetical protein
VLGVSLTLPAEQLAAIPRIALVILSILEGRLQTQPMVVAVVLLDLAEMVKTVVLL